MDAKQVLFVLTSHDDLGGVRKTGFHVNEAAGMWTVLKEAGVHVSLASVRGGVPPQDRRRDSEEAQEFLRDSDIARQLTNTPALSIVDPSHYDAVIFVGGHGAMWDFPGNEHISRIGRDIFESGGIVAAICHGPAALIHIRLSTGELLISGRRVSSFTNEEEHEVGLASVVPFLLSDALTESGATHDPAANFTAHAISDGRLITGQNPQSAAALANAVISALIPVN